MHTKLMIPSPIDLRTEELASKEASRQQLAREMLQHTIEASSQFIEQLPVAIECLRKRGRFNSKGGSIDIDIMPNEKPLGNFSSPASPRVRHFEWEDDIERKRFIELVNQGLAQAGWHCVIDPDMEILPRLDIEPISN